MAKLRGVNIEKLQGGLQRLATGTDNHLGLLVTGLPADAVATAINNSGKGVVLESVYDAEELGINAAYDANNSLTLYRDITEFFRLAPEATLYLFNSVVAADVTAFINQNKELKGFAVYITYNSGTPNLVTEINAYQTLVNNLAIENRLIDFVLIGANDLDDFSEDLHELNAPNVSVVVGCMADDGVVGLGSALGMVAVRKVNENLGSVDIIEKPRAKRGLNDYPLTDKTLGLWLNAYLTDGTDVESMTYAALKAIFDKGYIVVAGFEGYPGYFFQNSFTAVALTSDFAFIENNRVWNKAARIIRTTLLPRVRGIVKKDPSTGFIAPTTASSWKALIDKALEQMVTDDEISGFETFIDYQQVVNSTAPVKVNASVVADGIVHEFEVAVGLTNNI